MNSYKYIKEIMYESDIPDEAKIEAEERIRYDILNDMDYHLEILKEYEYFENIIKDEIQELERLSKQDISITQRIFWWLEIKYQIERIKDKLIYLNKKLKIIQDRKIMYSSREIKNTIKI